MIFIINSPMNLYCWEEKELIALDRGNSIESIQCMKRFIRREAIYMRREYPSTTNSISFNRLEQYGRN